MASGLKTFSSTSSLLKEKSESNLDIKWVGGSFLLLAPWDLVQGAASFGAVVVAMVEMVWSFLSYRLGGCFSSSSFFFLGLLQKTMTGVLDDLFSFVLSH